MDLGDTEFYAETRKQWGKVRTVTLAVYAGRENTKMPTGKM